MNAVTDVETAPPPRLSPESKRRALLICNGKFQYLKMYLPGVEKDAEQLSHALGDAHRSGFEVTCLSDNGLLEVRKAIAEACASSEADDTLLIYYSGTSVFDGGELLLPVADSDPTCLMATSIEAEFILSQMRRSRCRRFVLIVDGCHSGGFFRNNRGIPDGMVAITSCSVDELSHDTPEGGAFTQSLLRALADPKADRDHDGSVTVDDAYEVIRNDPSLVNTSPTHPQKWVWNLPEPIVLIRNRMCVFLSYSQADAKDADALVAALESCGMSVWRDISGVPGGARWRDDLVEALAKSQAVVLLMSEAAMGSKWVRRELEFADTRGLPIFPLVKVECQAPDWFDFQFGGLQRQKLDPQNFHASAAKLSAAVRRLLAASKKSTGTSP